MGYLKRTKKLLAGLLALSVMVTTCPQMSLAVHAEQISEEDQRSETAEGIQEADEGVLTESAEAVEEGPEGAGEGIENTEPEVSEDSGEDSKPGVLEEGGEDAGLEISGDTPEISDSDMPGEDGAQDGSIQDSAETDPEDETAGEPDEAVVPGTETISENNPEESVSENNPEYMATYEGATKDAGYGTPKFTGIGAAGSTIEWTIYENGTLVVMGEGEISDSSDYRRVPWHDHIYDIKSAVVEVTGMKNASYMFGSCNRLVSVDVSGWDMDSVTDMNNMFYGCTDLAALDLTGWKTGSVTNMSDMFGDCTNMTSLNLSGWDVGSVTDMSGMFDGCDALAALDLSGWDVGSVTDMRSMFSGCSSLASLAISGWNTGAVTNMRSMFSGCYQLAALDINGWDTSKVTDMNCMFSGCCEKLTALNLAGWKTGNVTDMSSMFSGCYKLTTLDLSGWDTGAVTNMCNMFYSCGSLAALDVSGWNTGKVTDMGSMFSGCSSLAAIEVSGWDTSQVTNMYSMFYDCGGLAAIDVSGWNTGKVTDMGSMFSRCGGLAAIEVSDWDTSKVTNMSGLFLDCRALKELDLSGWDVGNVDYASDMLYNTRLEEIKTPRNVRASVPISLPEWTDGSKWRLVDGTAVDKFPAASPESVTITRRLLEVSFIGENFTLKDSEGNPVAGKALFFRKGTKDALTFALEPAGLGEGYTLKPETLSGTVGIRNLAGQYRYALFPEDEEEGYTRDVEIRVETVPVETFQLDFNYFDSETESFFVSDGMQMSEENPAKVTVSNKYSTVVYVKPAESEELRRPALEIRLDDNNRRMVSYRTDFSVASEQEKTMVQKGYYVFDLGVVGERAQIWLSCKSMYQAHFITEGFPDGVSVRVHSDSDQKYITLAKDTDTVIAEKNSWLAIDVDFDNYQYPDYKWCSPAISVDPRADNMEGSGSGWRIMNWNNDLVTVRMSLEPTRIPLYYIESEVLDLRVEGSGVELAEDGKALLMRGGEGFSLSFRLADGVSLNDVFRIDGGNGAKEPLKCSESGGRYTVTYMVPEGEGSIDMGIQLATKDSLNRISLSDPEADCQITLSGRSYMYNGKAIEPEVKSVMLIAVNSYGKPVKQRLQKGDYTVSYANNKDAGTATVIITAAADSQKYRGSCAAAFEIQKGNKLSVNERKLPVDAELAGTTQQADLSELFEIDSPYEKNITPSWYGLKLCNLGDTLTETPKINGSMLNYSVMNGISKSSAPAKLVIEAAFKNYESISLELIMQPVRREDLVFGGTVTTQNIVYDGMGAPIETGPLYVASVAGQPPADKDAVMAQIKDDLIFHYIGTDGTVYDSYESPVDVGVYRVLVGISEENIDYRAQELEAGKFTISRRPIRIVAEDDRLYVNDTAPVQYSYVVADSGLVEGDTMNPEPVLTCPTLNMAQIGEYPVKIEVSGVRVYDRGKREVTGNYSISGEDGVLRVQEPELGSCTVVYDLCGKGNPIRRSGMETGSLLVRPKDPTAAGFVFLGWYRDETFAKLWDFETDILQGDMVLYAGWSKELAEEGGMALHVQEILPQTYTGKAIQPAVAVYAADGVTLLKKNKDYSIAYKNNTEADTKRFKNQAAIPAGGIGTSLTDTAGGFDQGLAYVEIKGKGNYTGAVYINFHINPADISAAGGAASDFTLKYTEQFEEKSGKTAAIVTQLKSKKAALKYGRDYTLTVVNTVDQTPATLTDKGQMPLNAGTYRLTVSGIDNYTGSFEKELYVASKTQLMKNAKVTCKGTVTDVTKAQLEAGIEPQDLQVSMNGAPLTIDTEYKVECVDNHGVGTATVTVRGTGGSYFGSKSVKFKIRGVPFREKEFAPISVQDMTYNGTALTQNKVALKPNGGSELVYGTDYTISYKNNVKKGKATMTFTAKPSSGYSGSFKKTFAINALALGSDGIVVKGAEKQDSGWMLSEKVPYQAGGATPVDRLAMQLGANGYVLKNGKDYTVKYKDNKEISNGRACMTLTGKGNFSDTMSVYFDIEKASLSALYTEKRVTVTPKAVKATFSFRRYRESPEDEWEYELKDPEYQFMPTVVVKDGKKALKQNEDYKLEYFGNVREDLYNGSADPYVKVTGIGNYSGTLAEEDESFDVPLSIFRYSLSGGTTYVVYEENEFTYTGGQIVPKISAVYYGKASDIAKAKREGETDEGILTTEKPEREPGEPEPDYEYGLTKLSEYREGGGGDYMVVGYGANTLQGRNGKVMIRGVHDYSGSVADTFTIQPKAIYKLLQKEEDAGAATQ